MRIVSKHILFSSGVRANIHWLASCALFPLKREPKRGRFGGFLGQPHSEPGGPHTRLAKDAVILGDSGKRSLHLPHQTFHVADKVPRAGGSFRE